MVTMLIQHHVKDYAAWKKVFDLNKGLRTSKGELSAKVYHDSQDNNQLTVMNTWENLKNAQDFVNSPELKAAMANAGVDGHPEITFLNEF
ncbi:MAG: antibiotic biosynthesis monooxygenase [Chloroflexota bacterium]